MDITQQFRQNFANNVLQIIVNLKDFALKSNLDFEIGN